MTPDQLVGPLAIVCHDAGAANLILSWIGRDIAVPVRAFMAGPAAKLWADCFPDHAALGSIEEALAGASALLSGTGWATDIEHRARLLAGGLGIRSVAVVDHWVNYAARFERAGQIVMPDAIAVTDDWAVREARAQFGSLPIWLWPNRYLETQLEAISPPPIDGDILYICEPARSNWGKRQAGEFQAIDFFIENLPNIPQAIGRKIRFRPHPSESPEKYHAIVDLLNDARIDESSSLANSISRSIMVGGMGSAAMVVALASGRHVFSSLPPWAPPCPLPHDGIVHLRDAVRS